MVKNIKKQYLNNSKKKILILSSSALTDGWGGFAEVLNQRLNKKSNYWDVYNASGVGFSSLDNLNTYNMLTDLQFDIILYYNGINDSRLNNCPPEVFKHNYEHIAWNSEVSAILRHKNINISTIPFFLDFSFQKVKQALCKDCFIADNYHDQEDWQEYGSNFKSLKSFQNNTLKIIEAKSNQTTLILVSFATYVPKNYSFESFVNRDLDYNYHSNSREVEIWGKASNVINFMDSLNNTAKSLGNPSKKVVYLDIQKEVVLNKNFADICHYSDLGIMKAAQLISDSLTARFP
jgi:hypothetical protein